MHHPNPRIQRIALSLAQQGGVSSTTLSKAAGISLATAAAKLYRYVTSGLLDRIEGDAYPFEYSLTKKGGEWIRRDESWEDEDTSPVADFGPLLACFGRRAA